MAREKIKFFWDIDDVKARTRTWILKGMNAEFGLDLRPKDWCEDFVKMTALPRAVLNDWYPPFFARILPDLEPEPGMREVLQRFAPMAEHHDFTSRWEIFREPTAAWSARHFPNLMTALHIAKRDWENDPQAHTLTKADDLRQIATSGVLIDNELHHCLPSAHAGYAAVRYCSPDHADTFVPYTEGPPTYFEAIGPEQLAEVLERDVLPLAA